MKMLKIKESIVNNLHKILLGFSYSMIVFSFSIAEMGKLRALLHSIYHLGLFIVFIQFLAPIMIDFFNVLLYGFEKVLEEEYEETKEYEQSNYIQDTKNF